MKSQLPAVQEKALAPAERMIVMIMDAARDKSIDIDKLERLMAMQREMVADQRRVAFVAAKARIMPDMPRIKKNGMISYEDRGGNKHETPYALLEDIDKIIRPIYGTEGFFQSYGTASTPSGKLKVILTVSHREGHSESIDAEFPIDDSGAKNKTQAIKSTVSYGRRTLTEMFWDLIEEGADTDGRDISPLTDDEVKDLHTSAQEVFGADLKRFLVYMKVGELKDILKRDLKKAYVAIGLKRDENAKKATK